MNPSKNILIAFLLNLFFSVFELIGGLWTGSMAILSDALHDFADACSIGLSFFLEKRSRLPADAAHTFGHSRYSALGSLITSAILLLGGVVVICNAVGRILEPVPVHYGGMMVFALVGVGVNFAAALFTRRGHSLNQRAVNLHMLEDMLGWLAVLVGSVVMRFTGFDLLDPILSIGVCLFILWHAVGNLRQTLSLFMERTPRDICPEQVRQQLLEVPGVEDAYHLHLWSLDEANVLATVHVVSDSEPQALKAAIRHVLGELGICHVTIETELPGRQGPQDRCPLKPPSQSHHHH